MLRLCNAMAGRATVRVVAATAAAAAAAAAAARAPLPARAAAVAPFSVQATPTAAAAAAVPPAAPASATPATASPSSASSSGAPPLTPTAAELALLSSSKPTSEQLAAFARDKERAAASKAEWDKWHAQQRRFGPAISDTEKTALKLIAAATALWVAYRAYLYSQIEEPKRPAHFGTADDDDDAIPAYPGAGGGAARSGPPKGFDIPALPYETHSLSQIFLSFAEPLAHFHEVAEEFVARKSAAEERMADLSARRKLGAINSKDLEAAELAMRKLRTEERLSMQPRLAYLKDLFKQRSLELMQRNQYNAERIVDAATKRPEATEAAATNAAAPAPSAAALKLEVEAELASLQQQIARFSTLPQIVEQYGFQQSVSAQRIMQPKAAAA